MGNEKKKSLKRTRAYVRGGGGRGKGRNSLIMIHNRDTCLEGEETSEWVGWLDDKY